MIIDGLNKEVKNRSCLIAQAGERGVRKLTSSKNVKEGGMLGFRR